MKILVILALTLGAFSAGYLRGLKNPAIERIADLENKIQELMEISGPADLGDMQDFWKDRPEKDDIARKHMIIAVWYAGAPGNEEISSETGHRWGPEYNRRSPVFILEERLEVMTAYVKELRRLKELAGYPIDYPTEETRDPRDGSRIDWEARLQPGNLWIGKNKNTGRWMIYEHGKRVREADADQLDRIGTYLKSEEKRRDPADPWSRYAR